MPPITHSDIDLTAYFQRIGFIGVPNPTLDVLSELQLRHALAIPWEDLNLLLRWPVKLDLASLTQKLIHDRRGGYCFEQNTLFQAVLEAIGFEVVSLQARVVWGVPEGTIPPRTHMALKVTVNGEPYLVDVGFGAVNPTAPLRLEPGTVQSTPHEAFRLVRIEHGYRLQAFLRNSWTPLYDLSLEPCPPIDHVIANYYVSTHPDSRFVNLLFVTRPAPEGRHSLTGAEYTLYSMDGRIERHRVQNVSEFRALLMDTFLIRIPDTPELGPILERVLTS